MKKIVLIPLSLIFLLLFSCKPSANKARAKVTEMEKLYSSDPQFYNNRVKTEELLKAYTDFAGKYEDDTATPHFLFNAANIAMNTSDPEIAIDLFKKNIDKGKENKYAPTSLFLLGFVYENHKNDLGKAKEAYTEFLSKYPDHVLAPSAKSSLDNLGKSPEQLIREFEAKNRADTLVKKK